MDLEEFKQKLKKFEPTWWFSLLCEGRDYIVVKFNTEEQCPFCMTGRLTRYIDSKPEKGLILLIGGGGCCHPVFRGEGKYYFLGYWRHENLVLQYHMRSKRASFRGVVNLLNRFERGLEELKKKQNG